MTHDPTIAEHVEVLYRLYAGAESFEPEAWKALLARPDAQAAKAALDAEGIDPTAVSHATDRSPARALYLVRRGLAYGDPRMLMIAAQNWLFAYASDGPAQDAARDRAVGFVLQRLAADDTVARDPRAKNALSRHLQQAIQALVVRAIGTSFGEAIYKGDVAYMRSFDSALVEQMTTHGERGKAKAEEIAKESEARESAWNRTPLEWLAVFELWLPSSKVEAPRFAIHLCDVLWADVVRPAIERETTAPHIRIPSPIAEAVSRDRHRTIGSLKSRKKPASLDIDWTKNVLVEQREVQLILPLDVLDATDASSGVTLRSLLTGGALRTYLASWAVCADHGELLTGAFPWEAGRIHREYFNRGDEGKRAGGRALQLIDQQFKTLQRFSVARVGDVKVSTPEPLINFYDVENSGVRVYKHAGALTLFMRDNFAQVPRAVLRLDAGEVPLAMGLALLLRQGATAMLKSKGTRDGDLRDLLQACGEDTDATANKEGPPYWGRAAKRLALVARNGELGRVLVEGTDPDAMDNGFKFKPNTNITLVMHERLAAVYRTLPAKAAKQARSENVAKQLARRVT